MRPLADTPQTGLVILTVAFLIAPGMDVFAKLLTVTHSPGMVAMGRFMIQTALMLPLVMLAGQWSAPRAGHWLAGLFLAMALLTINAAFVVMPIVNALAIFFVEPLVLTLLSAVVLGERFGWRRLVAVLIGLVGALVVIRPNWAAYGPSAVLPLVTALCFASYLLVTKVMAAGRNKLALQFWTGVSASLVLLIANSAGEAAALPALSLALPGGREVLLFLGMGALAVVSHQMIVHGLARVDASLAAPMQYLEIVSATLFGWWVFADFPDPLTWLGTAIIITSGLYVFHRERKLAGTTP